MKYSELKSIIIESVLCSLNEESDIISEEDTEFEYKQGMKWAMKHRSDPKGTRFSDEDLKLYPKSFAKGYKKVMYGSWWDNFNNKLTNFLGNVGYSRTRGL